MTRKQLKAEYGNQYGDRIISSILKELGVPNRKELSPIDIERFREKFGKPIPPDFFVRQ
jgi:hypothetical protein